MYYENYCSVLSTSSPLGNSVNAIIKSLDDVFIMPHPLVLSYVAWNQILLSFGVVLFLCSNKGVSDFKDVFYTINLLFFD